MKLFQYAVILKKDEESKIIVDITSVLAKDEAAVRIIAARSIPAHYEYDLNMMEILVRNF